MSPNKKKPHAPCIEKVTSSAGKSIDFSSWWTLKRNIKLLSKKKLISTFSKYWTIQLVSSQFRCVALEKKLNAICIRFPINCANDQPHQRTESLRSKEKRDFPTIFELVNIWKEVDSRTKKHAHTHVCTCSWADCTRAAYKNNIISFWMSFSLNVCAFHFFISQSNAKRRGRRHRRCRWMDWKRNDGAKKREKGKEKCGNQP